MPPALRPLRIRCRYLDVRSSTPSRRWFLHTRHEVDRVLSLIAAGWNDSEIARATGIGRTTVRWWRAGRLPAISVEGRGHPGGCPICDATAVDAAACAYLLGLYLGDGHIMQQERSFRLRISQDARYPHLIGLAAGAIVRVRGSTARVRLIHRDGRVDVQSHWRHWPCVFPQHGPGRKHERPISLAPWQQPIVDAYPRQLLRGLVHSDGCRCSNRVWRGRYTYPRYFFTNTFQTSFRSSEMRAMRSESAIAHRGRT